MHNPLRSGEIGIEVWGGWHRGLGRLASMCACKLRTSCLANLARRATGASYFAEGEARLAQVDSPEACLT